MFHEYYILGQYKIRVTSQDECFDSMDTFSIDALCVNKPTAILSCKTEEQSPYNYDTDSFTELEFNGEASFLTNTDNPILFFKWTLESKPNRSQLDSNDIQV